MIVTSVLLIIGYVTLATVVFLSQEPSKNTSCIFFVISYPDHKFAFIYFCLVYQN